MGKIDRVLDDIDFGVEVRAMFTAASGALEAAPKSCCHDHLEAMMETRWIVFTHGYVLPYLRPPDASWFSPEPVQSEMSAIVEHQHGYWCAGARAALRCLRAGCASAALQDEIESARKAVVARHATEGRMP
jgi:hypothetical protein